MPIYRLSLKTISRSAGRSSVAAAAYRAGTTLRDARTGRTHTYTRKRGVTHTALVGWRGTRGALWDAAEAAERRCDATVAREVQLALPAELSPRARRTLALAYAEWLHARYAAAVDVAIHAPGRRSDDRNHHAHLLLTTRRVEGGALTAKTRVLDDRRTGPREVERMRAAWAAGVNAALAAAGHAERVDHRSYARQEVPHEAAHVPRAALALEVRGEATEAGAEARRVGRRAQARAAAAAVARTVPTPAPLPGERRRVTRDTTPAPEMRRRLLAAMDEAPGAPEWPPVAPGGPQEPRTGARQPAPTPPDKAPPQAAERAQRATLARGAR